LQAALDTAPRISPVILTSSDKCHYTEDGFRSSWRKLCAKAGIKGLTFHDLRGTAVTRLSEADCTPQEVATITGHSPEDVMRILDRYLARTDKLAVAAMAKLERVRT
jgi:integrase